MTDENGSPKNYCKFTPPTQKKVRNPFDRVLVENLHQPICSPGMTKIYKKQANGSFKWEIDQTCTLVPEDIVPCSSQFEPSPDPVLERIAEEANEKFFSQELIMPSPLAQSSKTVKPLQVSYDTSVHITEKVKFETRDAQTVMTLPPELPPELEKMLEKFCTFTFDQHVLGEYEMTANGSLCRKLFFEEHSDMEHYDSELTDDELHHEKIPPSSIEHHTPVLFSPDLSRDLVAKGMKRTFGTPLKAGMGGKFRNKILDSVEFGEPCFSPIQFQTPTSKLVAPSHDCTTPSSFASSSISPVTKATSSDEEKNNFTSPESESAMATCLDCEAPSLENDKKRPCLCKVTPEKLLKRSASLKESPQRQRKASTSLADRRSSSLSSLHRSKSVQKLDFSMDMSIDGSLFNQSQPGHLEVSPVQNDAPVSWSIVEDASIQQLVTGAFKGSELSIQSSTKVHYDTNILDETPVKGKCKNLPRTHEISKIRTPKAVSPFNMSLDTSLGSTDNLNLEHKKIDFNNVDLKYLTEHSKFEYANNTKVANDISNSFKRVDSGYNENTFFASSYYESAIKPSELTITNASKTDSKYAFKEISNVNWMRVDSGFKDENSGDSCQFYQYNESDKKPNAGFSQERLGKENVMSGNFDRMMIPNNNEAMSMSDIFTEDITFNCNFSSTPSKNKSRKNTS